MIQVRILIGASIQQECLRFQKMLEDIFEEKLKFYRRHFSSSSSAGSLQMTISIVNTRYRLNKKCQK